MYDIIFLSFDEWQAKQNWFALLDRFPRAKRVDGFSPISAAHKEAARISRTEYFWVVDADNSIEPEFDFSFEWPPNDPFKDHVAVWRAKNNVNGLVYGYGGIKLLPKEAVLKAPDGRTDFTTSISLHFHVMPDVASLTIINTSEFDGWKAGFREATKLASKIIPNQKNDETEHRLETWCTVDGGTTNGRWVVTGARMGREYGTQHRSDPEALAKINDWEWLKEKYHEWDDWWDFDESN